MRKIVQNRNLKGFTLIELIVAMVIVGVIASLLVVFLMNSMNAFNRVSTRKSLILDASSSIQRFSREVSATYNIVFAGSKLFQFTTTTFDTLNVLEYEINTDGTLTRRFSGGNKELIAQNINYSNSNFTYYNVNDVIGIPIRRIRLTLLFENNNQSSLFTADVSPETFRYQ
ncbi:type II secretion system GspH family protein [bacterium]|nr:type II secretion system GspH family protein [bacterium]